jgi:hypothetical protein
MANMFPINSDLGTARIDDSGDEMNDVINAGKALFQYNRMFQNDRPLGVQQVASRGSGNPNMPVDPRMPADDRGLKFGGVVGGDSNPGREMNLRAGQDVRDIYESYKKPMITAGEILGKAGIKQNDQDPGMTNAIRDLDPDRELNRRVKEQTIANGQNRGWKTVNVTDPEHPGQTIAIQVNDITGEKRPLSLDGVITKTGSAKDLQAMNDAKAAKIESRRSMKESAQQALSEMDNILDKDGNLTDDAKWAVGATGVGNFLPGSPGASGAAAIKRIKDILTLKLIQDMKNHSKNGATGFGSMNIKELGVLEGGATKLDTAIGQDKFLPEAQRVKKYLQQILTDGPDDTDISEPGNGPKNTDSGAPKAPNGWEYVRNPTNTGWTAKKVGK